MKDLAMPSPNRVFDIIEAIQVKVEICVTVNQYKEQSVSLEELRVPTIQWAFAQYKQYKGQTHETENPTGTWKV